MLQAFESGSIEISLIVKESSLQLQYFWLSTASRGQHRASLRRQKPAGFQVYCVRKTV
jgi:hypothetical protein